MAADESLLVHSAIFQSGIVVRIYGWANWSVTIGRFQSLSRNFQYSAAHDLGIPAVRRITGGRAILHGDDLTVTVIAPLNLLGFKPNTPFSASRVYKTLSKPLISALESIGIYSTAGECNAPDPSLPGDCFQIISAADIVDKVSGSKIVGAALHHRDGIVMQQASIPLRTKSLETEQQSLRYKLFGGESKVTQGLSSIDRSALTAGLIKSYGNFFRNPLVSSSMTEEELNSASNLGMETYLNPQWTECRP